MTKGKNTSGSGLHKPNVFNNLLRQRAIDHRLTMSEYMRMLMYSHGFWADKFLEDSHSSRDRSKIFYVKF